MPAMPKPKVITVPGPYRVIDPGPKDAKGNPPKLTSKKLTDAKGRPKGHAITVPHGFDLEYELVHGKGTDKPKARIKVVKFTPARTTHADLEHDQEAGTVTAKSRDHEGIVGTGKDAAEAVSNMHAAIDDHLAKTKAADAAAKATADAAKATADAAKEAADKAKALHAEGDKPAEEKPAENELVTREG